MLIFLSILIGVITILFLITLHEFAHFVIAKLSGAYVYEFSVGMGPKIFQWGKKETRYTLRLLPLGGYVSIASEIADPPKGREDEPVADNKLMENINRGKKALFISAGAIMNLFLAFTLLIVGYAIFPYKQDLSLAPTYEPYYGPTYDAVNIYNNDPAHKDKITPKSTIEKIKNINWLGSETNDIRDYYSLATWIQKWNIKNPETKEEPKVEITFDKGQVVDPITKASDKYFLGVTAAQRPMSAGQVIGDGFVDTFKNSYSILQALGQLVTFHWDKISGPVGIVKSANAFLNPAVPSQVNASTYFRWAALLSANLFLLNMMPIPPLDGYKFVENAVEAATRKKLNTKFKIIISVIGAILFLGIFIGITIKDILF